MCRAGSGSAGRLLYARTGPRPAVGLRGGAPGSCRRTIRVSYQHLLPYLCLLTARLLREERKEPVIAAKPLKHIAPYAIDVIDSRKQQRIALLELAGRKTQGTHGTEDQPLF